MFPAFVNGAHGNFTPLRPFPAAEVHEADSDLAHPAAARPFRPVRRRAEGHGARRGDRRAPAGCKRVPSRTPTGALPQVSTGSSRSPASPKAATPWSPASSATRSSAFTVLVTTDSIELLAELVPEVFRGQEIVVVADRAKLRETPVALPRTSPGRRWTASSAPGTCR